MLFNIILGVTVLLLVVNILRVAKKENIKFNSIVNNIKKDILSGLALAKSINLKDNNTFSIAREFLFSMSIVLFFIMAVSGFLFPLLWQQMDGILLFTHVLIAPFFAVSVTLSVAFFANKLQFNSDDYKYLFAKTKSVKHIIEFWKKFSFWLFAVAAILNLGSIVLAMYPALGTSGQNWLLNIHRYSALALLVFTINYVTLKYAIKK